MNMPSVTYKSVNDNLTISRFENGWMLEFSGYDHDDDYKTRKIVASDLKEVLTLLEDYSKIILS